MVDPKNRQLRPPIPRSWLRLRLGKAYYAGKRYLLWCSPRYHWASQRQSVSLPYIQTSHATPLYRHLRGEEMELQKNKVVNLQLAAARLNGVVLRPGETFSYWRLIGKPSRKKGYRGKPRTMPVSKALREAFWGVMTPVVILGGIYGGVFTPTEAAAVAIFYGLFVGVFIYRTINKFSILVDVLVESVKATAVIMFVVTCAGLYAWVASTVGLVERGAAVLLSLSDNPIVLLLLINVILFIAGMLLDAISIYYVLLPFLLPIMAHFGWDPVWFGVMMTINLALGQVTPPVAVNLYVGAKISNLTMEEITPPVLPMLVASALALVVIVLFPDITLFLPRLLGM